MAALLELRSVSMAFGGLSVIDRLDLAVEPGTGRPGAAVERVRSLATNGCIARCSGQQNSKREC